MTDKEKQVWKNSEQISQQIFNLRNWTKLIKREFPDNYKKQLLSGEIITKETILSSINEALDIITIKNKENKDITTN